jgi:hypothetical protein
MFEVFAEREYHVARVEPLATLPVDKRDRHRAASGSRFDALTAPPDPPAAVG